MANNDNKLKISTHSRVAAAVSTVLAARRRHRWANGLGSAGARSDGLRRERWRTPHFRLVILYTVPIPLIAYALFGTSRTMVIIGPDSATALISGITIGALVAQGSSELLALTSAMALAVGVFFLAASTISMP